MHYHQNFGKIVAADQKKKIKPQTFYQEVHQRECFARKILYDCVQQNPRCE